MRLAKKESEVGLLFHSKRNAPVSVEFRYRGDFIFAVLHRFC